MTSKELWSAIHLWHNGVEYITEYEKTECKDGLCTVTMHLKEAKT